MISPAVPGPYTWDDFVALPDDDRRELIDGELVEVEVPTFAHEIIVTLLISFLANWAKATNAGDVFASGAKVRISPRRDARTLERLVLRDGVYAIEQSASEGEVFRANGFDGLEIPLAELWAAAERATAIEARDDGFTE